MRIVCLAENTACEERFGAEHGLSLYIESGGKKLLFDMGQTDLFSRNAEKFGIDLSAVDVAVLSHGHYDHGGGLARFLEINDRAPIYINKDAFLPHYNGTEKYIGLDTSLACHPRIVYTDGVQEIDEGMTLHSCADSLKQFDLGSFGLTEKVGEDFIPDDFRHEQYLLIREGARRILFSGCSHRGVLDIVRWFAPHVLVGGFHFSKLPLDATLRGYAEVLAAFDTDYITCHCTGEAQFAFMQGTMARLSYLRAGQEICI